MYLRTTRRRNKNGTEVAYLQLAHNEWDAAAGHSVVRVIHNFGRADQLDTDAIKRLIASLQRLVTPGPVGDGGGDGPDLEFVRAVPMGGAYALDGLWSRLGIPTLIARMGEGRRFDIDRMERTLFALVANRALAPGSKLAATDWVQRATLIDRLESVSADECYRAMDWLLTIHEPLAEAIYWEVADLLNLDVDLLFFDTTSTYFETDQPDRHDEATGTIAFRAYGNSKDHRPDLPQIVIGMAVTRTGIPIRVWCWPGNTGDQALIRQAKNDLRAWRLGRVVWVADRGFSSEQNRRELQRGGGHYIIGEKLRGDSPEAAAALARAGRYRTVAENLRVKEVTIDNATMRDRFVVCHNPEQAARDATIRSQILDQLTAEIAGTDTLPRDRRAELTGKLRTKSTYNRFLRVTPGGLLRINSQAVRDEERLDGKFLLRTSDPTLSTEDIALGYKQLLEVERGWRDMKSTIELRPVYHRLEHRIRAHVTLCWLALLLIRLTETATNDTWRNTRRHLEELSLGTFTGPAGTITRRTTTTPDQRKIFKALNLPEPPQFSSITPTPS